MSSDPIRALRARLDREAQELVDAGEAEMLDEARTIIRERNRRAILEASPELDSQIASAAAHNLDGLRASLSSTLDGLRQATAGIGKPPEFSDFGRSAIDLLAQDGRDQQDEFYQEIAEAKEEQERQRDEWRMGVLEALGLLAEKQESMISEQRTQGDKSRELRRSLWKWGLIIAALTSLTVAAVQEFELFERFFSLFRDIE